MSETQATTQLDQYKWQEKDTLRQMTSKHNSTVEYFNERVESLEKTSSEVNQGTLQKFEELDTELEEKFNQLSEEIDKKAENITAADIGLGNVDNTSDMDKPVSTAQQAAIDAAIEQFADEFTEEIPDEDPIGDDPEISAPVKEYIEERIKDAVSKTSIGIASETVLGGIKASDDIEVNQTTGKATVKGYSDLKQSISSFKETLDSNNRVTQKVFDNQGTMDDLQTEDKTTLVAAINEVFQLGSEKKSKFVENLTALGVGCSTDETWEELFTKMLTIMTGYDTSDATMTASNLLLNKIGYGVGGKMVGTMPDRSKTSANGGNGDEILHPSWPSQTMNHSTLTQYGSYGASGNQRNLLIMRAPEGYYDFNGRVYATPEEVAKVIGLDSGKIVSGNTILNMEGTGAGGDMTITLLLSNSYNAAGDYSYNYAELTQKGYDGLYLILYPSYLWPSSECPPMARVFYPFTELKELVSNYNRTDITIGSTSVLGIKLTLSSTGVTLTKLNNSVGFKMYGVKNCLTN